MAKNPKLVKVENIQPRLLSIEDLAKYLSIAPKTIRNRLGARAPKPFPIKAKKIMGRVLFDKRDVDDYLDTL